MEEARPGDGPTLHVVMRKEDLDPHRLRDKTVVVVDVLFATTSIVAALEHGVSTVLPARDASEARALSGRPGMDGALLSGETMFRFIEGFAPPTPLALCERLEGRNTLIYTTTNGTVALRACAGAGRVLVGSLINAHATASAIDIQGCGTVVILCAGTAGAFNLEDFYGAGCMVQRIVKREAACRLTDAARAARALFEALEPGPTLQGSLVGRLMHEWGLDAEVAYAARVDSCETAAELHGEQIRALAS